MRPEPITQDRLDSFSVESEKRLHGPQTAHGRLREWATVRHWADMEVWPEESAMYAILHNPGRATNTQSDGGMVSQVDRLQASIAMWERAREVSEALGLMPRQYRNVVYAMYAVEKKERPREAKHAALICKMPIPTYRQAMLKALTWIQGRLCLCGITESTSEKAVQKPALDGVDIIG